MNRILFLIAFVLTVAVQQSANLAHPAQQATSAFCDPANDPTPVCPGDPPWIIDQDCVDHQLEEFCLTAQACIDTWLEDRNAAKLAFRECWDEAQTIQDPADRAIAEDECADTLGDTLLDLLDAFGECTPLEADRQAAVDECCANSLFDSNAKSFICNAAECEATGSNGLVLVVKRAGILSTAGGWSIDSSPEGWAPYGRPFTDPLDFICESAAGCWGVRAVPGGTQKILFRNGDYVSTDDGWVLREVDGWRRVRNRQTPFRSMPLFSK